MGGNTILAVSNGSGAAAAGVRSSSHSTNIFRGRSTDTSANLLPVPMMNILNGGAHADRSVDFQEFM